MAAMGGARNGNGRGVGKPRIVRIVRRMLRGSALLALALLAGGGVRAQWSGYAGNPQHTAISTVASQSLGAIRWSTPVDESNPSSPIHIHYGSPLITAGNTVVVPVREADGSFRIDARRGSDG